MKDTWLEYYFIEERLNFANFVPVFGLEEVKEDLNIWQLSFLNH